MSLRAYRQINVLVFGDGVAQIVSFDLRDVASNNDYTGTVLNSPPVDVAALGVGATVLEHSRYNVTLSFATPPTDSQAVGLQLFY